MQQPEISIHPLIGRLQSIGESRDAGIAQFTGEDDEVMKNSEKIV